MSVESPTVGKDSRILIAVEPELKARIDSRAEGEGMTTAAFLRWLFIQWERQNPPIDPEKQQAKERQS